MPETLGQRPQQLLRGLGDDRARQEDRRRAHLLERRHVVGVNSLAAGHLTLVPALRDELASYGRSDILIVVGGVIPEQDFDELRAAGAAAIFPPGTVIATAALELLDVLAGQQPGPGPN